MKKETSWLILAFLIILLVFSGAAFWQQNGTKETKAAEYHSGCGSPLIINGSDRVIDGDYIVDACSPISPGIIFRTNNSLTITGTLTVRGLINAPANNVVKQTLNATNFDLPNKKGYGEDRNNSGDVGQTLTRGGLGGNARFNITWAGGATRWAGAGGGGFGGGGGGGSYAQSTAPHYAAAAGGGGGLHGVGGRPIYPSIGANTGEFGRGDLGFIDDVYRYFAPDNGSKKIGYGAQGGYGTWNNPTPANVCGTAGNLGPCAGGRGGGAINIKAKKIVFESGRVEANGEKGTDGSWINPDPAAPRASGGGGGSGGGVYLYSETTISGAGPSGSYAVGVLGGNGGNSVDCGAANFNGNGGGGGGGIVVLSGTQISINVDVSGGVGGNAPTSSCGGYSGENGARGENGLVILVERGGASPTVTVKKTTHPGTGTGTGCDWNARKTTFDAGDWVCVKNVITNPGGAPASGLTFHDEIPMSSANFGSLYNSGIWYYNSDGTELGSRIFADVEKGISGANPVTMWLKLNTDIPAGGRAEVRYRYQLTQ